MKTVTLLLNTWQFIAVSLTILFISSCNLTRAQSFIESEKIVASDALADDNFGNSVAISGDFAIVGSPESDGSGISSGAAYIYAFNGTDWVELQKLTATDASANSQFGFSVAIEDSMVVVGAFGDNNFMGAAYIFVHNGTNWVQSQKLIPFDGASADFYGYSVAISGNVVIIGSRYDDDNGNSSGSAYLYDFNGSNWTLDQKLSASDGNANDDFGVSVSISGDNAVIGAYADDDFGSESGSVYIFSKVGSSWNEVQKMNASDASASDFFGFSVDISGSNVVVGASKEGTNGISSGAVYVFSYDGSNWIESQKLFASDESAGDSFGYSVSISGDLLISGSYGNSDAGLESGAAYIFRFNGSNWLETDKLTASDEAINDRFGYSVCIDTNVAIVGAYQNSDAGSNSGSAYMFNDPTAEIESNLNTAKNIMIYPNPSNGSFQIEFSDDTVQPFEIVNSLGNSIPYLKTTNGDSFQVKLNVESGVYFVKSGLTSRKIVIQND